MNSYEIWQFAQKSYSATTLALLIVQIAVGIDIYNFIYADSITKGNSQQFYFKFCDERFVSVEGRENYRRPHGALFDCSLARAMQYKQHPSKVGAFDIKMSSIFTWLNIYVFDAMECNIWICLPAFSLVDGLFGVETNKPLPVLPPTSGWIEVPVCTLCITGESRHTRSRGR